MKRRSFRSVPLLFLESRPAIGVGKISYALYLWHWPIFVLWQSGFGSWTAPDVAGAMLLTFVLSIAAHVAVENPFRYSARLGRNPWGSLAVLSAAIGVCVVGSLFVERFAGNSQFIRVEDGRVYDLENVRRTRPSIYEHGCHLSQSATEHPICIYGIAEAVQSVVLFGDSHAAQWFPAFEEIAKQGNFALYNRTKSACSPIDIAVYNTNWKREYTECEEWRERVIRDIEAIRPAAVVIGMSSRHKPLVPGTEEILSGDSAIEALMEAERRTVRRLSNAGVTVILMRDTPWLVRDPLDCLAEQGGTGADYCQWPAGEVLPKLSFPWAAHDEPDVHILDFRDSICPNGTCKALQDGLITLRDRHHLSVDFSRSLMTTISARFEELLFR